MIPEAAVEAAFGSYVGGNETTGPDIAGDSLTREQLRTILEAAAPHMSRGPLVHAYAAAGFTACGLETGGAISRHDGYDGPAHRTTANDRLVTCEECK